MNYPKIADWIDEIAYQHLKRAWCDQTVSSDEYMRAASRSNRLKGFALFLGQTNYSYYRRCEDENHD